MASSVIVFGDSHVNRMAGASTVVDFYGVGGLNAFQWPNYLDVLSDYGFIIFQFGGNDVSEHPRRIHDPIESIGDTLKVIKEAMDWCRDTRRIGCIMPIISRSSAATAIHMLNSRLRKTFRNRMMPDLPEVELSADNVHVTDESYILLRSFVEQFAAVSL